MSLSSSDNTPASPSATLEEGPTLDGCIDPGNTLQIRARRTYAVSRDELFAAWTRRNALDSWMRVRSRSRVMLSSQLGGSFRLELAEGPTIHVITGAVLEVRSPDYLSLSWIHHGKSDHGSSVQVTFHERNRKAELVLLHRGVDCRREAAWLMHLWTNALARLGSYFAEGAALARSA